VYVRGKSKATLIINGASGSYGSSIVRYSIIGGGYSSTASSFTTGVLNTIGTNTFTATITDSRGRTATKTVTCSVVDYFTPRISYVEAYRCTSAGVIDENGTYIKVKADFTYASVSGKNTFSSNVSYAVYDSISWSTPVAITNNAYSSAIGGGAISIDNSYTVKFRVADYFTSHEVYETIPTPAVTMDFKKGGKGIGIGKVSQTDNLLDVAWNTNVDGDLYVGKRSYLNGLVDISGFTSIYNGMNVSNDANFYKDIYVTGWIRCLGQTGVYFQNYGGGLYMNDSTWLRSYNNKSIYTGGEMNASGGFTVSGTAVVGYGSGTYGEYIRFYDGTQICWRTYSSTFKCTTQYGSIFYANQNLTFPASFISTPAVFATLRSTGVSWCAVNSISTSSCSVRAINGVSAELTGEIIIVAIGRWK